MTSKKTKIMKKFLKNLNVFGLIAMLFGASLAVAFKTPETKQSHIQNPVFWVQTENGWEILGDRQYDCETSELDCSGFWPEGMNPIDHPNAGEIIDPDGTAVIFP